MPDKIKFKLSSGELYVLVAVLTGQRNHLPHESFAIRLIREVLKGLSARLANMWFNRVCLTKKKDHSVSLSIPEALAFHLFFSQSEYRFDAYTSNTINRMCNEIHQRLA